MPDSGKIMAAMEPADVAQLAMVEAMRSIADSMKGMQTEAKEQAKLLLDVRERVVRIEAAAVDQKLEHVQRQVEANRQKIDALEADKDRREGAYWFADAARRWMPSILTVLAAVIILLRVTGRLGR